MVLTVNQVNELYARTRGFQESATLVLDDQREDGTIRVGLFNYTFHIDVFGVTDVYGPSGEWIAREAKYLRDGGRY